MKGRKTVALLFTAVVLFISLTSCTRRNNRVVPKNTAAPGTQQNTGTPKIRQESLRETATYWFPAEFEKQQAIWMQWPSEIYNQGDHPVAPVSADIINALAAHIKVNVAVQNTAEIEQIKSMFKNKGYTGSNVQYYEINHQSIWARDVGPIFVKDNKNHLNVVDFGFNNYSRDGSEQYIATESSVDKQVAQLYGYPLVKTNLISEGGAIESNGKGTLMMTESVILKRNPGMSKQQIENEYRRVLGVNHFIWLKKGLAEDDRITSGHINEIARFSSADTILLAEILEGDRYVNDEANESYLRMEENFDILKKAVDQDGKPFKVIRIPMPPTLYQRPEENGKIPIRSYLNYCATNGAVVMQVYWRPGMSDTLKKAEDKVKATIGDVYPGREIISIDALNINLWGGGIHCVTQHMPE